MGIEARMVGCRGVSCDHGLDRSADHRSCGTANNLKNAGALNSGDGYAGQAALLDELEILGSLRVEVFAGELTVTI